MHAVFWIMTLLMTGVALLFVLTPLARARRRNTPALLAIAMPAFAAFTYLALGSPGVTQPGHRGEESAALGQQIAATDKATSGGVAGSVTLSPVAEKLVEPGDTVFVFARAPGKAGAPVAVARQTADAWPVEFRLTDAQSMTDGVRLSDLEQVVITARISRRGDASRALRSLQAKSQPITIADTAPVYLTIK
jgi:cytochrome c-type biogenesis protein CcmH